MINRFRVQNFKALRDVTLELSPLHVLIGPNDSGKTSILQAIGALCRSVDHTLPDSFTGLWTGRNLVWQNSTENVVFAAWLDDREPRIAYEVECRFLPNGRNVHLVQESLTLSSGNHRLGSSGADRTAVERESQTGQLNSNAPQELQREVQLAVQELRQRLSPVHSYCFDPSHLAMPAASDKGRTFRLDYSGFGLATCLDDILSEDRTAYDEIERRYREIFPKVRAIKLRLVAAFAHGAQDPQQVPRFSSADGKGIFFEIEGAGDAIPAAQVSSGMLLVLAYLTLLCLPPPKAPRLLLVEEFENGLHPKRLEEVVRVLQDLVQSQDRTQILLTTHSPYAIDLFRPDEVTLCHKQDDGSIAVRRLSESDAVRKQLEVFTLGEIWTGEGDEALLQGVP